MSTIRTLILVITTVSTLALATATAHHQGGNGPQKLTGPSSISTSFGLGTRRTTPYTYTVTLSQIATSNVVCTIGDVGGHIGVPLTVTIPNGSRTATFPALGISDGQDTLVVYNSMSSASIDVTISSA